MEISVIYKNIEEIKPYENNPRINDAAIDAVANSIKEFGFKNPIIVDKDNVIVCGHTRRLAAKKLGLTSVPCVVASDLTPEQIRGLRVADNKTSELSTWDLDKLTEELKLIDIDMAQFGFEDLLDKIEELPNDDEFDVEAELNKPAFSKKGDIWCLGRHKVICGDSTLKETYRRLLEDKRANLVVTDAPYMVDLDSASGKIQNDNLKGEEAYKFLLNTFTNLKEFMREDASIYEFYATSQSRIFYDAFDDAGFKLGASLVWKKERAPLMRTDWKFNFEPVLFGWRKDGKHIWYGDQKQKACFEFDSIKNSKTEGHGHPSSKPVPLISYLIKQSSRRDDLVLDSFLGSASTLIACEDTGRTCYGIELEEKFVDVAVKRFIEHIGSNDEVFVIRDGNKIAYKDLGIEKEEYLN